MQQFISTAEACALLDRTLQTVQALNQALASLKPNLARVQVQSAPPVPVVVPDRSVLPQPETAVAPVLTIKLADLMRAGAAARNRRQQHNRPARPNNRNRPKHSHSRDVEVIYRKSYRVAS